MAGDGQPSGRHRVDRVPTALDRRTQLAVGLPLLAGLIHVAVVGIRYHVGSFDDDASYILSAKVLLAGGGLSGHLPINDTVSGLYPPGYPALLAPLVWLWPHYFLPLRLLSVVLYAATFPLTWVLAGRWKLPEAVKVAALAVLALGPPFATYASMVMAETPFVVNLLLVLLAVDTWTTRRVRFGWPGLASVVLSASLVWLKQAGIGVVAGLVLWLVLKRMYVRAVGVGGGVGLSLLPVLLARKAAGIPLAGSRYSAELGAFYSGDLASRLRVVLPHSAWHLLSSALPATLLPYLEPLPINDHWPDLWKVLSWHVTVLCVIGAYRWARRRPGPAVAMIVVYLLESVLWPYVNERRTILVLPLLVLWYVLGAEAVWLLVRKWRPARPVALALTSVVVVLPLLAQVPRDYLFPWGASSSDFGGSSYAYALAHLGPPSEVVETDYRSSVSLFTGHRTNWNAFIATSTGLCYGPGALQLLRQDGAGLMVIGDFNKPHVLDSPCLLSLALTQGWAVPVLHAARDDAWVFELAGPGTIHPHLASLMPFAQPSVMTAVPSGTQVDYLLYPGSVLDQVTVGPAEGGAEVAVETPDGAWHPLGHGRGGFVLLASASLHAVAVRVTFNGPPGSPPGQVSAIGSR